MKIMILTNSSNGLWGFRQELIKELLKKNEVIAMTPYDGFVEELNELGCKTIELSIDRKYVFSSNKRIYMREKLELPKTSCGWEIFNPLHARRHLCRNKRPGIQP